MIDVLVTEEGHSSVIRGLVKCGWRPPLTPDDSCPTVMLSLIEHCCNVLPDDRPDFNGKLSDVCSKSVE